MKYSPEDEDIVRLHAWHTNNNGYIYRGSVLFHRLVAERMFGTIEGYDIHHINGNKTDNRRENLVKITHGRNMMLNPLARDNTSGHKGVYWHKTNKNWFARCNSDDCSGPLHLGTFQNFNDAVSAREDHMFL